MQSRPSVRTASASPCLAINARFMFSSFLANTEGGRLEFNLEFQIGAVPLKVRQVERPRIIDRVASDLRHERGGQQHLAPNIDLHGRSCKESMAVEGLERQAFIGAVVFRSEAQGKCWRQAVGEPQP